MNFGRTRRPDDEVDINVTSFIDVLLLLLIFFMLATTFVSEGRVNIKLPDASAQADEQQPTDFIEIVINANGEYQINGQSLASAGSETLQAAITQVAGDKHDQAVLIRADANARHQSVVTAMDVVGRMGFKALSIATINQPATNESGRGQPAPGAAR